MTIVQYLSAFRLYGADVLLIALGVSACTSLLKKTVLKNRAKKLCVFAPFVLGTVFYAVFRAIATKSAAPFTADFAETLEGGFACGCAATLYYVIYEQFFRNKTDGATAVLTPLLEGIVPDEHVEELARILLAECKQTTQEERARFVQETLSRYDCPLGENERAVYCNLVASYLAAFRAE